VMPTEHHPAPVAVWGNNGCNDCCNGRRGGLIAGFELVIVQPHFDHGNDRVTENRTNDPDVLRENPDPLGPYDNKWDLEPSYRFFLGYVGAQGLGARARYWWFDHEADRLETGRPEVARAGGRRLPRNQLDADLRIDALDVEVTQAAQLGYLDLNFAGGVRWGSVETDQIRRASDTRPFDEVQTSRVDFDGVGPTLALEIRRPVGAGGLALVATTRGSLLFGESEFASTLQEPRRRGAAEVNRTFTAMEEENDVVYTAELQLGAEYRRAMRNGAALSFRVLFEGQLWGGAAMDGFHARPGLPDPRLHIAGLSERSTTEHNIGLVGITVGLGLDY